MIGGVAVFKNQLGGCTEETYIYEYSNEEKDAVVTHDTITYEGYAPTCEETGLTEGSHCTKCDGATVEQEEIPALEHTWIDATYEAPKTCSVCGKTEGEPLVKETETESHTEGVESGEPETETVPSQSETETNKSESSETETETNSSQDEFETNKPENSETETETNSSQSETETNKPENS